MFYHFKKYIGIIVVFCLSGVVSAQEEQPKLPDFSYTFSKQEVKVGEDVELIVSFNVPKGCHVYSTNVKCEVGPSNFLINLKSNSSFKKVGAAYSKGDHIKMDDIFNCQAGEFTTKGEVRQKIKILSETLQLSGTIEGQICTESMCFQFNMLNGQKPVAIKTPSISILPADKGAVIDTTHNTPVDTGAVKTKTITPADTAKDNQEKIKPGDTDENGIKNKGLFALFLLGISGGLLALVTPCVFPMIPMTVAYFTKQEDKRKGRKMALFYGFSIVAIFLVIGLAFSAIFGKSFGNQLSSHWFPNLLFFGVFIVFGFSFLGAFELTLPSSMVNNIDQKGDKGGYLGVFFIALTLVVVSFSCTVPIVGQVAILASNKELIRPFFALLGFALTFAIPFTVFAFFPQWLKSLPKSGGWLNVVKVVLGFIELALALKFFSNADLSYHWGILNRDVFLSLWIAISFFTSFYLLGFFKTHNDSDVPYLSVTRLLFAVFFFGFSVYMVPGLFGAPLKPLSGLLPPPETQEFRLNAENSSGSSNHSAGEDIYNETVKGETIKYADIPLIHIPLGLKGYFDLEQAKKASVQLKKPVFIDFTGHNCANCRRMENNVWSKPEILELLRTKLVKVALYADEQTSLPESEQYLSKEGNDIETIGQKNGDIQYNQFGSQGQPYYYIINGKGDILSVYHGYNPDVNKFMIFLEEGIRKFKP